MPTISDSIRDHHHITGGDVVTKRLNNSAPKVDKEQRLVSGYVTTARPDLEREVIVTTGIDTSYFPNVVKAVYFDHNYNDMPVGTCRNIAVREHGKALWAQTYILPNERGDDLIVAIDGGAVNGFSIGVKRLDYGRPSADEIKEYGECDVITRKSLLLEYSVLAGPCNPDALIDMVSKGLIRRRSAVAFGLEDTPERTHYRTTPVIIDGQVLKAVRK